MSTAAEHLLDWLRDAHAMEQQAEKMLSNMAERLEHYPALRHQIELHIEETHAQRQLLKGCLERLGHMPSATKDITGRLMAFGQSVTGMTMSDEVVKGTLSSYVFEQMEIATYTILIAAAEAAGDIETQRICELILPQEIAMATWLSEHMPEITFAFLSRDADPEAIAKR
jgi:ferritin-like metal-binding protein YciE